MTAVEVTQILDVIAACGEIIYCDVGDSTYVHVNTAEYGSNMWRFEFVSPDHYKIHLADPAHGAVGHLLSAHGTAATDSRGGDSTYIHVNTAEYGSNVWRLERVG